MKLISCPKHELPYRFYLIYIAYEKLPKFKCNAHWKFCEKHTIQT